MPIVSVSCIGVGDVEGHMLVERPAAAAAARASCVALRTVRGRAPCRGSGRTLHIRTTSIFLSWLTQSLHLPSPSRKSSL